MHQSLLPRLKERLSLKGPKPCILPLPEYQLIVGTRLNDPSLIHVTEECRNQHIQTTRNTDRTLTESSPHTV